MATMAPHGADPAAATAAAAAAAAAAATAAMHHQQQQQQYGGHPQQQQQQQHDYAAAVAHQQQQQYQQQQAAAAAQPAPAAAQPAAAAAQQPQQQAAAGAGAASSSSSNVPVQRECAIPGKTGWVIWRTPFEIDDGYAPIKAVGKGAYGVVCSARALATGEKVAIKKIANAFENLTDARRTLREIKLLRHLRHENVIGIRDIMRPPGACLGLSAAAATAGASGNNASANAATTPNAAFSDVYLVYELMDTDLHQIIRSAQPLTNEHFQYFIYQVLRGLRYVHSAGVLHRDLKPSNLLLNASCDLKICDFGLARTAAERSFMTEYVVTRWYRAPELLLSCEHYTASIDVWSVGCILAELLGRRPLFPGKDYVDQLKLVVKALGPPSDDDLSFIGSSKARAYIRALPQADAGGGGGGGAAAAAGAEGAAPPAAGAASASGPAIWAARFPDADPLALDLLSRMLQFDPRKRIDVAGALAHPWLAALHDPAAEPVAPAPFEFDFEEAQLTEQAVRELVYEEIRHYHPEMP